MTQKIADPSTSAPQTDPRKERLAAELRANLRRRKAQGRAQAEEVQNPETEG